MKTNSEDNCSTKKQNSVMPVILRGMAAVLIFYVLGLFMISPVLQLFIRVLLPERYNPVILTSTSIQILEYQQMIRRINEAARFVAGFIYIYCLYRFIADFKKIKSNMSQYFKRIIPMMLFFLFAVTIAVVTKIRGANEYDLTGHPYMYESIYSYITYPLVYFFCGMLLFSEKLRKALVYVLIFSSIILNVTALVNEWIIPIKECQGTGLSAVFHQFNHYGYYLALVTIAGALMFVYEKKLFLKISSAVSAVISAVVLIMNDTFGAYLAVFVVLVAFLIYSTAIAKSNQKLSIIVFIAFILITVIMSFFYKAVVSSVTIFVGDIGKLATASPKSGSAGTGRWALWKGTVQHLPESPWLGFGVEGLLNTYYVGTPHNEFLQYAEFFGIPAVLLYISACFIIVLRVFRNRNELSTTTMICFFVSLTYLISSFVGVAIYYTTPFFYIFLGLTYAEYFKKGAKTKKIDAPAE